MDALRNKIVLNEFWKAEEAPWKTWDDDDRRRVTLGNGGRNLYLPGAG